MFGLNLEQFAKYMKKQAGFDKIMWAQVGDTHVLGSTTLVLTLPSLTVDLWDIMKSVGLPSPNTFLKEGKPFPTEGRSFPRLISKPYLDSHRLSFTDMYYIPEGKPSVKFRALAAKDSHVLVNASLLSIFNGEPDIYCLAPGVIRTEDTREQELFTTYARFCPILRGSGVSSVTTTTETHIVQQAKLYLEKD